MPTSDLVDLVVPRGSLDEISARSKRLPLVQLPERAIWDLELLATGAFSPLDGFMGQRELNNVLENMRLESGALFPIPITLPLPADSPITLDTEITLCDSFNNPLAIMRVDEAYSWDPTHIARHAFGTEDSAHPLVREMESWGTVNVSGPLQVLALPAHHDFRQLRLTPSQTQKHLSKMGHNNTVAFQTRNPLHRAHEELTKRAIDLVDGALLLHPVVGMTRPGDVDHFTRVRSYLALAPYYPKDRFLLALLPLAMRMAGPREALWHALIRRNYGATHFIIGRDHASPGLDSTGKPFYGPYAAQDIVETHQDEIGIQVVRFALMNYLPSEDRYAEATEIPKGTETWSISGTEVREKYLAQGNPLPAWFTRPEVAAVLSDAYPPRLHQGFCIWINGLNSTRNLMTARAIASMCMEFGRSVSVLDTGDVPHNLIKASSIKRDDQDADIQFIGFVASEIVGHLGIAICINNNAPSAISNKIKRMVGQANFFEVFMDSPAEALEVSESIERLSKNEPDEVGETVSVNKSYEEPESPEIVIANSTTLSNGASVILAHIRKAGFLVQS